MENREVSIKEEAAKMHETASKRSKTILVVGLVIGAIAGIVGGALALAGIVAGTAAMIPFIIAGIIVFAGIIFSIASLPETDQMYEARLTVEYAKEALISDDKGKAEALRYLSKIIEDTAKAENESFYSDDRNNLLRLAVQTFLVENKKEIISCLNNNDSGVKSGAINLLTKAIGRKDLFNEAKEILADIFIKSESKDTAKKLFADGILNQGTVEKMIHDESTKDEMLDLLALMSKDKDLKNVVVDLVDSNIIDKLTKLNPESTTEETPEEKNKIIEEIKNLKLGPPEKLNADDIVYKEDRDLGKNLTVLEQSEENIQKANKIKETFKNPETVKELKDMFSKNDGLHHKDGEIQKCFLQDNKHGFNKIDSKKVAEQSIMDLNRDLFSIKGNNSKYIIKSQDKVGEELKNFWKMNLQKTHSPKSLKMI